VTRQWDFWVPLFFCAIKVFVVLKCGFSFKWNLCMRM
jgi:hypothetical protein